MTDEYPTPNPEYDTFVGSLKTSLIAILPYVGAAFITATASTYAVLVDNFTLPTNLGSALWVGVMVAIVVGSSLESYRQRWCD